MQLTRNQPWNHLYQRLPTYAGFKYAVLDADPKGTTVNVSFNIFMKALHTMVSVVGRLALGSPLKRGAAPTDLAKIEENAKKGFRQDY